MTFDEYNTDANFDDNNSSLDELVKIGVGEGKTADEIKNSLSPKWQKSKKIGEFDNYFNTYSKPKEEPKEEIKEEVKETVETPANTTSTTSTSPYKKTTQNFVNKNDSTADEAKGVMQNETEENTEYNIKRLNDMFSKREGAYGNIQDHLVEQMPTFIWQAYNKGEFGDTSTPEGKKNAKLRLAHFIINGVGTALQNASNVINKREPNAKSDWEIYKDTNLQKGLEDRWNKYNAETKGAIEMADKVFGNDQDATFLYQQLTKDRKAQTRWNMMDENQKLYTLEVTKEIGNIIGDMNIKDLSNFVCGSVLNAGDANISKDELVAIGVAKFAANSPNLIEQLPDGQIKDMVKSLFAGNYSVLSEDAQDKLLGIDKQDKKDGGKHPLDAGLVMSKEEYQKLVDEGNRLIQAYYKGEINKQEFLKQYGELETIMNKHPVFKGNYGTLTPANDIVKSNYNDELKEKFGNEKGTTYKNGKKAVDYFTKNSKLFDYLKSTDRPYWAESQKIMGKKYSQKDFNNDVEAFKLIKNNDALSLVGKY